MPIKGDQKASTPRSSMVPDPDCPLDSEGEEEEKEEEEDKLEEEEEKSSPPINDTPREKSRR
jgi:hypothetical protein